MEEDLHDPAHYRIKRSKYNWLALLSLCASPLAVAQVDDTRAVPQRQHEVEEIVVTAERRKFELRLQMMEAERAAYELFNSINDDRRFHIFCNEQVATGSRIQSDTQHCQPEFEIQALRAHSRDYLENLRVLYDAYQTDKNTPVTSIPAAAVIAGHQQEFREKMQETARQHPEFLQALVRYSELKAQYEAAE